jgi:hypothetical protein
MLVRAAVDHERLLVIESSREGGAGRISIRHWQHWKKCLESVALQETALRHCRELSCVKPSRGIAARFDNGTKHFSEFASRFHRLY